MNSDDTIIIHPTLWERFRCLIGLHKWHEDSELVHDDEQMTSRVWHYKKCKCCDKWHQWWK